MDINGKFEGTVWGVLRLVAGVAVVVSGATWVVAKLTESNELQAYKVAKEWKANESIAALEGLSQVAGLNAAERTELLLLQKRVPELERVVADGATQLAQVKAETSALRGELSLVAKNIDHVEIPLGESRYVIPNSVLVGVHSIYTSSNRCGFRVAEHSEVVEIGQPFSIPFGGKAFVLTLSKVTQSTCTFAFFEKLKG